MVYYTFDKFKYQVSRSCQTVILKCLRMSIYCTCTPNLYIRIFISYFSQSCFQSASPKDNNNTYVKVKSNVSKECI